MSNRKRNSGKPPAEEPPVENPGASSLEETSAELSPDGFVSDLPPGDDAEKGAPASEEPTEQQGPTLGDGDEGILAATPASASEPPAEEPPVDEDEEDDYPGKNPPGSVTGTCLDGTQITIPLKTADQISEWFETLEPGSVPASAKVYDEPPRIVVVAYPSPQKATFLL